MSPSSDPGGLFEINASGQISLTAAGVASAANDFEALPNDFTLSVTATDTSGNTSVAEDVTVTVGDVDASAMHRGKLADMPRVALVADGLRFWKMMVMPFLARRTGLVEVLIGPPIPVEIMGCDDR